MSESESQSGAASNPGLLEEIGQVWRQMPDRWLFVCLLGLWVAFFHALGNSERGYVNTSSIFLWLEWIYTKSPDDSHGRLMPFVVLGLLWWKREELLAVPKRNWWPALALVVAGLLLHILGFVVQQARICVVGFFIGLYGITGLVWGWHWLKASFFPYFLFSFCLPMASPAEVITFPMRMLATSITSGVAGTVLGLNIIQDGTRIFDAQGGFQYEVAAACGGLRSLTATLALSTIYGFMNFKSNWRRGVMILSAFPLAVAGNVMRLSLIIVTAEAFGQKAGDYVHDSSWLSLLPYVPAVAGIALLGHFLREGRPEQAPSHPPVTATEPVV